MKIPLLDEKYSERAVLNPKSYIEYLEKVRKRKRPNIPKFVTMTFWPKMYEFIKEKYKVKEHKFLSSLYPTQILNYKNSRMAFMCLPFTAPAASTFLDPLFELGCEYAIFFGDCGVLSSSIKWGEIIIPNKALRDEGTSYHYEKPSRYTYPSKIILKYLQTILKDRNIKYYKGATWTTDAIYRETPRKVKKYYKEGCLAVEMEASALFSIARYRKKHIGALLNAADCVAGEKWDSRSVYKDVDKEKAKMLRLLELSFETLRAIDKEL